MKSFLGMREDMFISLLHYLDPYGTYQTIQSSYEQESVRAIIFADSASSFLSESDIHFQLEEEDEKIAQNCEFIAPGNLYSIPRGGIFREVYEEPNL
jgi:hypothetical protein